LIDQDVVFAAELAMISWVSTGMLAVDALPNARLHCGEAGDANREQLTFKFASCNICAVQMETFPLDMASNPCRGRSAFFAGFETHTPKGYHDAQIA
jgi:hypothetical protein